MVFCGFQEKSESQTKVSFVEDRKVHALLFAQSFETEIGFGFGLASYVKAKPELAICKHPTYLVVLNEVVVMCCCCCCILHINRSGLNNTQ